MRLVYLTGCPAALNTVHEVDFVYPLNHMLLKWCRDDCLRIICYVNICKYDYASGVDSVLAQAS
jgi:hypothetical protein